MKHTSLDEITHGQFLGLQGERFQVREGQRSVSLRLVQVSALARAARDATRQYENFSLLFEGVISEALDQHTHRLEHPTFGAFDLFIVPVGIEGGQLQYQAVINRNSPDSAP